jgi:hypothetical protein
MAQARRSFPSDNQKKSLPTKPHGCLLHLYRTTSPELTPPDAFKKPIGEDSHRYDVSPAALPVDAGCDWGTT